ncbi:MAG: alpha/beta fold hydrolase [Anaerolineae bacterium]|nr:alpha/beta fold hydrolase [Anaerolineae bacterium]
MTDLLIVATALVILVLLFWYLQLKTGFLSTRFFVQVGGLIVIGGLGIYLGIRLLSLSLSVINILGALALFAIAVYHLAFTFFKLTTEADSRYRKLHKANRAVVNYDMKHERFVVTTDDGVKLRGVMLNYHPEGHDKAVIVCHGAGRSKNTIPIVQTCEVLATRYVVFAFDFRGHMESGGEFKADGDTDADLKAVIDYVRGLGYQKVAVFGWSIGAWTALLSASRGRLIDAIIAGSPPPINIADTRQIELMQRYRWISLLVRFGVAVMRNFRARLGDYALQITEFAARVPANIPVLLVFNDYDYTSRVDASKFDELYEKLPGDREKLQLPGKGHLFDWPNTYFLWTKMLDWLNARF